MKINFLFTGTFWGIVLILFGISALLRSFNINIPVIRIIFGLIIVYVGISILAGGSVFTTGDNNVIFSDINIRVTDKIEDEYNIIFGNGIIDLREISPDNYGKKVEINTIFGASQILINPNTPISLEASAVFGRATAPDGSTVSFGDYSYRGGSTDDNNPLKIEANAIFGSLDIRNINK